MAPVPKEVYLGLDGRAVLVTGAAAGVGRAVALWLARAGCDVAVVDASAAAAERVAEELREDDFTAIAVAADVASAERAAAVVDEVVAQFGAIDFAVCCPAALGASAGTAAGGRLDTAAAAALARAAAAAMEQGGAVVLVAPGEATGAGPGRARSPADELGRLTASLAAELAPRRVRVNAIAGAAPAAPRVEPARRRSAARAAPAVGGAAEPDDFGRVAVFLVSDLGRSLNAQVLTVGLARA